MVRAQIEATRRASLVSAIAFAAVDVNKASQAELESLKGVGPGDAAKLSAQGLTVNGTEFAPSTSTKPAKTRAGEATPAKSEKPTRSQGSGQGRS